VGDGNVGPRDLISLRVHFERFPATVKGAFVLRGADPNPHQVVLEKARVRSVGDDVRRDLPLASATLDVAPRRDVYVPFELSVTELPPGWYALECDLVVDGMPATMAGERRFFVPWPRGSVRKGEVRIDANVALSDGVKVSIERAECALDSVKVIYATEPHADVRMHLVADGDPLHELEREYDDGSGRGKLTATPILRSQTTLHIDVGAQKERARGKDTTVEVALP
jgi:hypothetical protein